MTAFLVVCIVIASLLVFLVALSVDAIVYQVVHSRAFVELQKQVLLSAGVLFEFQERMNSCMAGDIQDGAA